jgi:ABC-type nitrate/sulfonate/bicarbonate transport system substrate-binding protein
MVFHLRFEIMLLAIVLVVSTSMAQEKTKIYLGASSKTLGYSPLWVATKKGFFEQQGLDVQLVLLRGMPMTVQALAAGSLHFGSGGPEPSAVSTLSSPAESSTGPLNSSLPARTTKATKIYAARPSARHL